MIQKVVKKHRVQERTTTQDDLAYWLSKTPEERVATVDYLRTILWKHSQTSESCSRCSTPGTLST